MASLLIRGGNPYDRSISWILKLHRLIVEKTQLDVAVMYSMDLSVDTKLMIVV